MIELGHNFRLLMIGQIISHYRITEKLGGGGMGEVYKADDLKLYRTVALKFLPPEITRNEDAKKRFVREAQAASSLQHDNICVIHDIDETDDGRLFICMEYYKGETLGKKNKDQRLKMKEVLDYSVQIARGLASAHDCKMIHRDIKPANIMITKDDEVKIVDFGLARLIGQSRITRDGMTPGTLDYMSPEQASGKPVDQRTDIWSLGVLLYELLTGEVPFKGEYDQAKIYSIINEDPEPPSSIRSDIPQSLNQIINHALAKDPDKRYPAIRDMLYDLEKIRSGTGNQTWQFVLEVIRKRRVLSVAVVILIAAAALFNPVVKGWQWFQFTDAAYETERMTLAIMVCENLIDPDDSKRLGEIITDALITDLQESRFVHVISLQHLYDILKNKGIVGKKIIDKTEQLEVARRAHADRIVSMNIAQMGVQAVLTAHCIDVHSGQIIKSVEIPGSAENIYDMVDALSTQIRMNLDLPVEAQREQDRPVTDVTTRSYEAYRYYLFGEELAAQYDMKRAAASFEQAVRIDSTFASAYSSLSRVYEFLRMDKEAGEAFKKAIRYMEHLKEREKYGILYQNTLEKNDTEETKKILYQWIDRYPDDKLARLNLGDLYADQLHMYDEAIFQYKRATDLDGEYRLAYNAMGYAYACKGMKAEALTAIKKYVSLAPDEFNPYDSLGEIYMNLCGDYKKAESAFLKAVSIKPDFAPHKLAEVYQLQGRYKEAESIYRDILYKDQLLPTGIKYFLLARLNYEKQEYEQALDCLVEAKFLKPDYESLYWLKGLTLVKLNHVTEAEESLQQLEVIKPESRQYCHLAGFIALARNENLQAIEKIKKAAAMIPYIAWNYYEHREYYKQSLAEVYLQTGRVDQAISECKKIIGDNPNWALAYYLLGQIYEQKGEKKKAMSAYRDFLKIWDQADPDLPQIVAAGKRIEFLEAG